MRVSINLRETRSSIVFFIFFVFLDVKCGTRSIKTTRTRKNKDRLFFIFFLLKSATAKELYSDGQKRNWDKKKKKKKKKNTTEEWKKPNAERWTLKERRKKKKGNPTAVVCFLFVFFWLVVRGIVGRFPSSSFSFSSLALVGFVIRPMFQKERSRYIFFSTSGFVSVDVMRARRRRRGGRRLWRRRETQISRRFLLSVPFCCCSFSFRFGSFFFFFWFRFRRGVRNRSDARRRWRTQTNQRRNGQTNGTQTTWNGGNENENETKKNKRTTTKKGKKRKTGRHTHYSTRSWGTQKKSIMRRTWWIVWVS